MALNTYGGFAQGFQQGFGLMEGVKGRRLKEEQFENQKEKQGLDEQYRQDTLSFQKEQEQNTQDYRSQDLDIKRASAEASASLSAITSQTALLNAQTAGVKADTELAKQNQLTDPSSLASQEKQASIDKVKAEQTKLEEETSRSASNRSEYENAARLNKLFDLAQKSQARPLTNDEIDFFTQTSNELQGGGRFDLGYILSEETQDGITAIGNYVTNLANGQPSDMTAEVMNAFDGVLGISKSAAVGRTIDDSFVNAPDWMKGGDHKIVSQGLHEVGSYNGRDISGTMYVMVENQDTGEVYPYFPPLTASRNNVDNKALTLTFDEVMQASAGTAHMIQQIAPVLERPAKEAKIKSMFGDNKGSNGVEQFNAAVDRRLESVRKGIQSGSNTNNYFFDTGGMSNASTSEKLAYADSDENRRKIEQEILYGPQNKKNNLNRIGEWFQETSEALNDMPMPNGFKTNLGGVVKGQWTPQNVSILQGFYNPDGTISDEQGLIAQLQALQFIK
jgi:hypothetical protein